MLCVASAKSRRLRSTSCCQCSAISAELHKPLRGMSSFSSFDIGFPSRILLVLRHSSLSSSQYAGETLHTLITNKDAGRGCPLFRDADLCREEAGGLLAAAPTEGAEPGSSGRHRSRVYWPEAEAKRTKQACANPLPFVYQARQQMHRADA